MKLIVPILCLSFVYSTRGESTTRAFVISLHFWPSTKAPTFKPFNFIYGKVAFLGGSQFCVIIENVCYLLALLLFVKKFS